MDAQSVERALIRRQFFRIGGVVSGLGFILVGILTLFLAKAFGWQRTPAAVTVLMFLLFLFTVGASFYLVAAPCPRCGKKFWYDEASKYRNQLTPQCLNCGLPINWRSGNGRAV